MNLWLVLALLVLLLALAAIFAGAEIGFYSLSRPRVAAQARAGQRSARILGHLMRDDSGVLLTLLVGGNLVLQALTLLVESEFERRNWVSPALREVAVALALTPLVFFFGALLPKDLFHRRPHTLMAKVAWFLAIVKGALTPLVIALRSLTRLMELLLGIRRGEISQAYEREGLLALLEEGKRSGVLLPHAEKLAHNALKLRSLSLSSVMVPWGEVESLNLAHGQPELYAQVAHSRFTRLPLCAAQGEVLGYVHQLEVLAGAEDALLGGRLEAKQRPLLFLPPTLSVDRALARMRVAGQRMAVVGTPNAPSGLVTLKDLVETISGDLERW